MTRADKPLGRRESTIRKTRSGWRPSRAESHADKVVGTGIAVIFAACVIEAIGSHFAFLGILFTGSIVGISIVAAGVFLSFSATRRPSFQTPEKWYGLPRSAVLAIAPLEGERRNLRSDRAEGQRILHALPEDSLNRQRVQDGVDRLEVEMSALEMQIESIIDEHSLESETSQKIRAEDARTRKEIDAEERADDWLG